MAVQRLLARQRLQYVCCGYVLNDGSCLAETYSERGNALLGSEQGLNNLDRDNDRRWHQRRRKGTEAFAMDWSIFGRINGAKTIDVLPVEKRSIQGKSF